MKITPSHLWLLAFAAIIVASCDPESTSTKPTDDSEFDGVVIPISVTDYNVATIRLDQEPLVFSISAVIGTTSCYTYSHMEFKKTANQVDVWLYGIYDSTRNCISGEIAIKNVEFIIAPPFENPLTLVFHQADSSRLEIIIDIRSTNGNPQWAVYTKDLSGLPSSSIEALISDGEGRVWVGSSAGIFHFDGQSVTNHRKELFTPYPEYEAMTMDHLGNLWVGSYSSEQIAKFNGNSWVHYDLPGDSYSYSDVHSIVADAGNRIWVGTHRGQLLTFDGVQWFEHQVIDSLSLRYTESLIVDPAGHVWVSGVYGLLGEWNGTDWLFHKKVPSVSAIPYVQDMKMDSQGNIWVTDWNYGLRMYDGTRWEGFPYSVSGSEVDFRYLEIDSQDNIWVVSSFGLLKFDGNSWTAFTRANTGIVSDDLRVLAIDENDQIWLGTHDLGLTLFKNGN